jgi:predicted DsbA family dithiol-disulfide isomerase
VLVEIWSDVVCPWCHVGKARFEAALARLPWRDEIEVVYRPFQLDPRAPLAGEPVAEAYRRKFGPDGAVAVQRRIEAAAEGLGLRFDWPTMVRANTFDAHRLLAWALDVAGPAAQHRLKQLLLEAYFTGGRNVGDRPTLVRLVTDAGLDGDAAAEVLAGDAYADAVVAGRQLAEELDIHGVPTFVIDRAFAIPGAQDPDTIVLMLERARERLAPMTVGPDGEVCRLGRDEC